MFQILWAERICSLGMFGFFLLSILVQVFLAAEFNKLIGEAENMSVTKRKELKAIKTKFLNSYGKRNYEEEDDILGAKEQVNVEVFVNKAIARLKICGQRPYFWKFISTQLFMAGIICAGAGSFRQIALQRSLREVSVFYLIAFIELYVYFSVISLCDLEGRDKMLRLTIVEYIDNHMLNRIQVAKAFQAEEKVIELLEKEQEKQNTFSMEKEQELEDLLQDFLV